jgi:phenylalanyl-tRNA synthetase beta subunit
MCCHGSVHTLSGVHAMATMQWKGCVGVSSSARGPVITPPQRILVALCTLWRSYHFSGYLVQGPFSYRALDPTDITFVPLKQTEAFQADALMEHYLKNDQKLKKFVPLIKDSKVYPVIYDSTGTVLSLPPIINGAHSAITLDTKNVFIECTATDLTKAKIVLNTLVTMFSECDLGAGNSMS